MLNSWPIPVREGQGERSVGYIGGVDSRALSGQERTTFRAQKTLFKGSTPLIQPDIAKGLEGFLRRQGWRFPWDSDLYSALSKVSPASGYTVYLDTTGTLKFGPKKLLSLVTTSTVILQYDLGLTGTWTIMWWQQSGTSGTWHHYTLRSSGVPWVDGVAAVNAQSVTVASGIVKLWGHSATGTTGTQQCFDDMVVVPFYVPDDALPYFAARTAAFSDLPRLFLTGTAEQTSSLEVVGNWEGSKMSMVTHPTAGLTPNAAEVRFSLDAA